MPVRNIRFLNKNDIFGKSIPGAVLVLGAYLLLPNRVRLGLDGTQTQLGLILRIVLALLFGLLIGEAIHTLSRLIEGLFIRVGSIIFPRIRRLKVRLDGAKFSIKQKFIRAEEGDDSDGGQEITTNEESNAIKKEIADLYESLFQTVLSLIAVLIAVIIRSGERINTILYPVFQRHRVIFYLWQVENYGGEENNDLPWSPGKDRILAEEFGDVCDRLYDIELEKRVPEDNFYTMIASSVSYGTGGLSQRFQDLYSFSRSMWAVLLVLLSWYYVLFFSGISSYYPWWYKESFTQYIEPTFVFGLVGFVLFLLTAGRYKVTYVVYLISDFVSMNNKAAQ